MTIVLFAQLTTAGGGGGNGRATFAHVCEWARAAHRAGIDALLFDDRQSLQPEGAGAFEAGTLTAALAAATDGIGLVPSISTEHLAPYHVARLLATIDYLSGGRVGWEMRTPGDGGETANYRADGMAAIDRQLARAEEFAQVVGGLWDSFDDDAFLRDRESGVYFLPERLHTLDHEGEHFEVAGPLNIARPPQGHPVSVRRVDSDEAAALAGRVADVAIVPIDRADEVREIGDAVTEAALGAGRRRGDVLILLERSASTPVEHLLRLAGTGVVNGFSLLASQHDSPEKAYADMLETATAVRSLSAAASGATLRARLGLRRPPSRWTAA
ncbi:LLM class flavin-dependent oxidoreductase [Nocardia otitidiscaviarum]|uniref:LLM class flavin-dependent oxidoreductase n=1 Tax=Nocardia otitidiscaviarum TaxID=1823 RepID=A0A516NMG1_9NOCA|nr:LLM class flavin-dependent oxidoreductase [Nocardia otitidiscaviarum]MCP9624655.1 LLM class flavin-dependent oxidoreductase [Nocardia otitidiscaviarum]QDP80088.1 LLM class flavin-dependent oxidoreductase [Nocardia otitidiscaviarum]